jgi:hypothetical protein
VAIGVTARLSTTVGTGAVIIGTLVNVDISGSMMKAIQFILLFDKLRLINVYYDNLLGVFMESIVEAFKARLINIDDFEDSAKVSANMFQF